MFTTGLMELHLAGKVSNAGKGIFDGVSVTTFALGTAELYRWLDGNDDVAFMDVAVVNDPTTISRNAKLVSINGALSVDLYGQVVADTIDGRQISGVGGHEDFVAGAELHRTPTP
jgi:acyl-CoA hydrolase